MLVLVTFISGHAVRINRSVVEVPAACCGLSVSQGRRRRASSVFRLTSSLPVTRVNTSDLADGGSGRVRGRPSPAWSQVGSITVMSLLFVCLEITHIQVRCHL